MNTHYTLRFHTKDDYMCAKQQLTYTSYNDKLKELYMNNNDKYAEILNNVKTLSFSFCPCFQTYRSYYYLLMKDTFLYYINSCLYIKVASLSHKT